MDEIGALLFRPSREQEALARATPAGPVTDPLLFFCDDDSTINPLVRHIEEAAEGAVCVTTGPEFRRGENGHIVVEPDSEEDYAKVFQELARRQALPCKVVFFWPPEPAPGEACDDADLWERSSRSYRRLRLLGQALAETKTLEAWHLYVVSTVSGPDENPSRAAIFKSLVSGPVMVLPQEVPGARCCWLDIQLTGSGAGAEEEMVAALFAELARAPEDEIVVYRDGCRIVDVFEPLEHDSEPVQSDRLRDQGVYLITGGLSGLGLAAAEFLARGRHPRLVLVSRTGLPQRRQWADWLAGHPRTDRTSRIIRLLTELEAQGSEVYVASVDVTQSDQLRSLLEVVNERFGPVNGVLHCAGVASRGRHRGYDPRTSMAILEPRVIGTLNLDVASAGTELDFLITFGCLKTITGAAGETDEVAAEAFLRAFARYKHARPGSRVTTVSWCAWRHTGKTADAARAAGLVDVLDGTTIEALDDGVFARRALDTVEGAIYATPLPASGGPLARAPSSAGERSEVPPLELFEFAWAAIRRQNGPSATEIRNLYLSKPLRLAEGVRGELRARLSELPASTDFIVSSRIDTGTDEPELLDNHLWGSGRGVTGSPQGAAPATAIVQRLSSGAADFEPAPVATPADGDDSWRVARCLQVGEREALAELVQPEAAEWLERSTASFPRLLESASRCAEALAASVGAQGTTYRPLHCARIVVSEPVPERVFCYVVAEEASAGADDNLAVGATLMSADGTSFAVVEALTLQPVGEHDKKPAANNREGGRGKRLTAEGGVAQRIAREVENSLTPDEGLAVLGRLLSRTPIPEVVVSRKAPELLAQERKARYGSAGDAASGAESLATTGDDVDLDKESDEAKALHERRIFSAVLRSRSKGKSRWQLLVPIQPEGDKPPFFCVHGRGGNVLNYFILKEHLGPDQPLYGLQCRGLDGLSPPFENLETMAAHYNREIKEVQPRGPYYVGGGSMGGMIALEMAQQLLRSGDEVALLAMFDTYGYRYEDFLASGPSGQAEVVGPRRHLYRMRSMSLAGKLAYVSGLAVRNVQRRSRPARCAVYRMLGRPLPFYLRDWHMWTSNMKALSKYVPEVYPGAITLFRAEKQLAGVFNDPELGWSGRAFGGIKIVDVFTDHNKMVEHPTLGQQLSRIIEETQASYSA